MKKIHSLLMIAFLLLATTSCADSNIAHQEMSMVYLPVTQTEYNADGSRGECQITWTYNEDGLPLTKTCDRGLFKTVLDEQEELHLVIPQAFDELPDTICQYTYNDHGDLLYQEETIYRYNNSGELTETEYKDYGKSQSYTYHYDNSGNLQSIDLYAEQSSNYVSAIIRCEYTKSGRLFEVTSENLVDNTVTLLFDFRYDAQDRLVDYAYHSKEGTHHYQYQYNNVGLLTKITRKRAPSQTCIDDDNINRPTSQSSKTFTLWETVTFEYDDTGNLIARTRYDEIGHSQQITTCKYENGELVSVSYNDGVVVYTKDDHFDSTSNATLVLDDNRNIIKAIKSDGSYIEFEYQAFALNENAAKRCKNTQHIMSNIDATGGKNFYMPFSGGHGFLVHIPIVETILHQTDVLVIG